MAKTPSLGSAVIPDPRLLAAARVLAGLSQRELAELAGIHRTVIGRYEAGTTNMRADLLGQVLVAFGKLGIMFLAPTAEWSGGVVLLTARPAPEAP